MAVHARVDRQLAFRRASVNELRSVRRARMARQPSRAPAVLQVLPRLERAARSAARSISRAICVAQGWRSPWSHPPAARSSASWQRPGRSTSSCRCDSKNPLTVAARHMPAACSGDPASTASHLVHARSRAPAWQRRSGRQALPAPFVTTCHEPLPGRWLPQAHATMPVMASRRAGDRGLGVRGRAHRRDATGVDPSAGCVIVDRGSRHPDEFDPERGARPSGAGAGRALGHPAGHQGRDAARALSSAERGHLLLLQAMARLRRLDLHGTAWWSCDLEHAAPAMRRGAAGHDPRAGLGERVRFGGDSDDLPAALSLADIVVRPRPGPTRPAVVGGRGAGDGQARDRRPTRAPLARACMPAATGWLVPPGRSRRAGARTGAGPGDGQPTRARGSRPAPAPSSLDEFGLEQMCERTLARLPRAGRSRVEPGPIGWAAERPTRPRLDGLTAVSAGLEGGAARLPDG